MQIFNTLPNVSLDPITGLEGFHFNEQNTAVQLIDALAKMKNGDKVLEQICSMLRLKGAVLRITGGVPVWCSDKGVPEGSHDLPVDQLGNLLQFPHL